MNNNLPWLLEKERWIAIIGLIIILLGFLYSAYGLDRKRRFLRGLSRSLLFGIVGGAVVGLGLGFTGFLDVIMLGTLWPFIHGQYVVFVGYSFGDLLLFACITALISFLLGLVVGIILGFLIGFVYPRFDVVRHNRKLNSWLVFMLSLVTSQLLQYMYYQYMDYWISGYFSRVYTHVEYFLDIPLWAGCLFGLIFFPKCSVSWKEYISQRIFVSTWKRSVLYLAKFVLTSASALLIAGILISYLELIRGNTWWILNGYLSGNFQEFLFGLLIGIALNQSRNINLHLRKVSWPRFIIWIILGIVCGSVLERLLLYLFGDLYSGDFNFGGQLSLLGLEFGLSQIGGVAGLLIGIIGGRVREFAEQPKLWVRVISEVDENGVYYRGDHAYINWARFFRGFVAGIVIFVIYTLNLYIANGWILILSLPTVDTLVLALAGGILIGFTIGGLYGFGPFIFSVGENLSDSGLGYIGLFLTFLGSVVLILQTLIS